MPRRSSGGRSAARAPPRFTPMRNPRQQAPAPAPVQSGSRSILGEIGSTIAEGMAFSTGAEVARRAVDAIMGHRTIQHETVVSIATDEVAAPMSKGTRSSGANSCSNHSKAFQDCISDYGSDISKCQFYLDMLNECRKGYGAAANVL